MLRQAPNALEQAKKSLINPAYLAIIALAIISIFIIVRFRKSKRR